MLTAREVAGRVVLAVADHDGSALLEALRALPREQNFALMLSLAETAAMALEELHGDGWRDALSLAILEASLDDIEPTG